MAILAAADQPIFFPSITLTGDALTGYLMRVQAIVEGPLGAARPLEQQVFVDHISLNVTTQTAQLAYLPIHPTEPITIEVRTSRQQGYGLQRGWQALTDQQYFIERDNGGIEVDAQIISGFTLGRTYSDKLRATYTSGFDFEGHRLNPALFTAAQIAEINQIKTVAGIFAANYTAFDIANQTLETKVEYVGTLRYSDPLTLFKGSNPGATQASLIENYLLPLKKYLPRKWR